MGISEKNKKKILNICFWLGALLIGFHIIIDDYILFRLFGLYIKKEIGILLSGIGFILIVPKFYIYGEEQEYPESIYYLKSRLISLFSILFGVFEIISSVSMLSDTNNISEYVSEILLCFRPLSVCLVAFYIINIITKGRCDKKNYLITAVTISILHIIILYPVIFYYLFFRFFYLTQFILLLLFCVNAYISIKRFYDSVTSENKKFIAYLSSIVNLLLYFFISAFVNGLIQLGFVIFTIIILINIIPIVILYSKEKDINIKPTDISVNYRLIFNKYCGDKHVVEMDEDNIYINNFKFSLKHTINRHTFTSYNGIDNNLLVKYFKENGIRKLGIHYMSVYYDLTDAEYDKMLTDIKSMENVVFIEYPFVIFRDKKIFIRKDGGKYSITFLTEDKEKLRYEIGMLNNISKKKENEKYVCCDGLKIENIIWWINKCLSLRSYV
jgi:hypothetical protein